MIVVLKRYWKFNIVFKSWSWLEVKVLMSNKNTHSPPADNGWMRAIILTFLAYFSILTYFQVSILLKKMPAKVYLCLYTRETSYNLYIFIFVSKNTPTTSSLLLGHEVDLESQGDPHLAAVLRAPWTPANLWPLPASPFLTSNVNWSDYNGE